MYYGFTKNITALTEDAISGLELNIQSMTIRNDLLTKTTSEFLLLAAPSVLEIGNIFGVYDEYGEVAYTGIITEIEDNTVYTAQIEALFDDLWQWVDPRLETIEASLKQILEDDFQNNADSAVSSVFSQFTITTSSSNEIYLGGQSENYTVNFMDLIFKLYDTYQIRFTIDIPVGAGTPTIDIGVVSYTEDDYLYIDNNSNVIKNFNVTSDTAEANKLIVNSTEGVLRQTYYLLTDNTITTTDTALNRYAKTTTKVVYSDDDLDIIVAENLPISYNHEITCTMNIDNELYDVSDFILGKPTEIVIDDDTYDTIYTGYEMSVEDTLGKRLSTIDLVFGKTRDSLSDILLQQTLVINDASTTHNTVVNVKTVVDREIGEIKNEVASITNEETGILAKANAYTDITANTITNYVGEQITNAENDILNEVQTRITQSANEVRTEISENYVANDDEDYVRVTTTIIEDSDGLTVIKSTEDTYVVLAADGMYVKDKAGNNVTTATATSVTQGEWVMQQTDQNKIFNIFRKR